MRILVIFDLPVGSKSERKSYSKFRKFLLEDGFHMEQFSVYSRIAGSRDKGQNHINRIRANLPEAGAVTVIMLTEAQYAHREVLLDTRPSNWGDGDDYGSQLTLVF